MTEKCYKATVPGMLAFVRNWIGDGKTQESAHRIAEAYMAINGFECVGFHGDALVMAEDRDIPASGMVLIIDDVPENGKPKTQPRPCGKGKCGCRK